MRAQLVKSFADKSDDPSLIPRTHMTGENQLLKAVLRLPQECHGVPMSGHRINKQRGNKCLPQRDLLPRTRILLSGTVNSPGSSIHHGIVFSAEERGSSPYRGQFQQV